MLRASSTRAAGPASGRASRSAYRPFSSRKATVRRAAEEEAAPAEEAAPVEAVSEAAVQADSFSFNLNE